MEEDIKSRFEDFDKRFQTLEKRHDDIKFYLGGAAAFFGLIFTVFTYVANSNISDERAGLRQFEENMRSDLGKAELAPDLQILGPNGASLSGQLLPASVEEKENGQTSLVVTFTIRNAGVGNTGPIYEKFYAKEPVHLGGPSTDERLYKFEAYVNPDEFTPNDLPGGNYASSFTTRLPLDNGLSPGKYPVLMKVYFGKGRVTQAEFVADVKGTK